MEEQDRAENTLNIDESLREMGRPISRQEMYRRYGVLTAGADAGPGSPITATENSLTLPQSPQAR
jgi:hypothetical protein